MKIEFFKPRYWGIWIGVALFWLISRLPVGSRHALGNIIGKWAWRYNHKRRNIVLANLRKAFPQWTREKTEEIGNRHFQMMGQALLDSSVLWFGSRKRIQGSLEMVGWRHFERARASGKKVIFQTAHWTGLEFGAAAIGLAEPGYGVYNPLKNPLVDHLVYRSRVRFGNRLIARQEGFRPMIRALRQGHFLYLVSDEDLGERNSVYAPFLGATKATIVMPARLAKMTDAVVLPMAPIYAPEKRKYIVHVLPPLDDLGKHGPEEDARLLNRDLEKLIGETPEQYMWTLKLFRTQPNGENIYA